MFNSKKVLTLILVNIILLMSVSCKRQMSSNITTPADSSATVAPAAAAATIPDAPSIGSASAGNVQAIVSFTAPVSDGGATILSYTAHDLIF